MKTNILECDDEQTYLRINIGEVVGKYIVVSKLGQGVFSNVIRAKHLDTGDEVAIKVSLLVTITIIDNNFNKLSRSIKNFMYSNIVNPFRSYDQMKYLSEQVSGN